MIDQQGVSGTAGQRLRADLVNTIRQVSTQTGVDFDYLLQKAAVESSFDPKAQAPGSSARGLYQFIDNTWLETIDRHGADHGLAAAAAAITRDADGRVVVSDAAARRDILALRDNPRISALMAAELALDNKENLEGKLGREVGNTELYMAHFLGAGGAARFLAELDDNPASRAAQVNPAAARANSAVFYDNGKALTVDEVFARFAGRFDEPPPAQMPTGAEARPASAIAAAAIPAAAQNDIAAPAYSGRSFDAPSLRTVIPDGSLSIFALSILQSMRMPGDEEPARAGEWVA